MTTTIMRTTGFPLSPSTAPTPPQSSSGTTRDCTRNNSSNIAIFTVATGRTTGDTMNNSFTGTATFITTTTTTAIIVGSSHVSTNIITSTIVITVAPFPWNLDISTKGSKL